MRSQIDALIERIQRDPEFHELVRKRSRFAWGLSRLMMGIYFGFILLVAFWPAALGAPIGSGVTTLGIPLGLGALVVLSPAVWVATFGFQSAPFPYDNPALFSMSLAFFGIWVFSKLDQSPRAGAERALRCPIRALRDGDRRRGRGRPLKRPSTASNRTRSGFPDLLARQFRPWPSPLGLAHSHNHPLSGVKRP